MSEPLAIKDELIADMIKVAYQVGKTARKMQKDPESLGVSYKSDKSVVTFADQYGEGVIKEALVSKFGGGFEGEETGKTIATSNPERIWRVDPIDGTGNYSGGTGGPGNYASDPNWGVSIALEEGGVVTHAVVYLPATREIYWAIKGQGSYVMDIDGKEKRLQLGDLRQKTAIELAGGFSGPNKEKIKTDLGNDYRKQTGGGSRNLGCVVAGIVHVATGARGAFTQGNVNLHDIAAATLVATEAGATFFMQPVANDPKNRLAVIISHPSVHDSLVQTFRIAQAYQPPAPPGRQRKADGAPNQQQ